MDEPTAVVRRWVDATNAGDDVAFRALFHDDAVLVDTGRTFRGLEAIVGWSGRELIGAKVRIDVLDIRPVGDTTVLTSDVRSSGFNGTARLVFRIAGGLIERIDIDSTEG